MLMLFWMKIVQLMNWSMLSKETEFIFQLFMFWIKLIKFQLKNLMLFIKFRIVCQLVLITRLVHLILRNLRQESIYRKIRLKSIFRKFDSVVLFQWNFDDLLETLWEYLDFTRIYTKPKGQLPDYNEPVILRRDNRTVEGFVNKIHRTLLKDFKHALVWGSSVKHNPQVSLHSMCTLARVRASTLMKTDDS